jgi:hypothetical protein
VLVEITDFFRYTRALVMRNVDARCEMDDDDDDCASVRSGQFKENLTIDQSGRLWGAEIRVSCRDKTFSEQESKNNCVIYFCHIHVRCSMSENVTFEIFRVHVSTSNSPHMFSSQSQP